MKTIEIIKSMPEIESARKYKNHLVIRTNSIYIEGFRDGSKFSNPLLLGKFKIRLCLKKCPLHDDRWDMKGTNYKRRNGAIWYHPHFNYIRGIRDGCYDPGTSHLDPVSRLVTVLKLLKQLDTMDELFEFYGEKFIKEFFTNDMCSKGFPNLFEEKWKEYYYEANVKDIMNIDDYGAHQVFYPPDYCFYSLEYREDGFMIFRRNGGPGYYLFLRRDDHDITGS